MRRPLFRFWFAAGALLSLPPMAHAKAHLQRVVVEGAGLVAPVAITDPDILQLSNPWDDYFASWLATGVGALPPAGPTYRITVYARLRTAPDVRAIYRFRYAPGRGAKPGYVYLPGKGEPEWPDNAKTIFRAGLEGRWHLAAPEWERHMRRRL